LSRAPLHDDEKAEFLLARVVSEVEHLVDKIKKAIKNLFEEAGREMRRQEILEALRYKASKGTIDKALKALVKEGALIKEKRGREVVFKKADTG